jgi:hypothetical protein
VAAAVEEALADAEAAAGALKAELRGTEEKLREKELETMVRKL